jgi:uncharacterized damage-inducible protein DinB
MNIRSSGENSLEDKKLRKILIEILEGQTVYCGIEEAVSNVPFEFWGKRRKGVPYTLFELLEHIRLSNHDILEYLTNPEYSTKDWPEAYWPKKKKPKNEGEVDEITGRIINDLKSLLKLIKQESLLDPFPFINKQHTLTREVVILANHLAYHTGQFVLLRRLLGIW